MGVRAGWVVLGVWLAACSSDADEAPVGAAPGAAGQNGSKDTTPFTPGVAASGFEGFTQKGLPNPGGKCEGSGGTPMKLPVSGASYCVKASPGCDSAGTACPLYVTINTAAAFFPYLDDPKNAPAIVVELYTETDGDKIKDKLAEVPRVIANDYPGLDRARIYAVGWSAGAGAVGRGLCHVAKKSDQSPIGTTSDVYAAVVAMGGCGCSNNYAPIAGNWHVLTWNGSADPFNGGDACEAGLRQRAAVNGCANPQATWAPVARDDVYARNADGSANAERLDFGACARGDVSGYRFKDEAHVVSAKKHFDPKISGYETLWRFLQGKRK